MNTAELIARLKAAAEKASNGEWFKESGDGWEATCSANDQANSGFIIAHFEGPDAAANRKFVQAANPVNVLALVEALESAQRGKDVITPRYSQFLSDVMTAAGLLSHGKRDKGLAERLSSFCVEERMGMESPVLVAKDRIAEQEAWSTTEGAGVMNIGNPYCEDHLIAWTVSGRALPPGIYRIDTVRVGEIDCEVKGE